MSPMLTQGFNRSGVSRESDLIYKVLQAFVPAVQKPHVT